MRIRVAKTGRHVGFHQLKVNQSGKLSQIPQIGNQIPKSLGPIKAPKIPKLKKLKL